MGQRRADRTGAPDCGFWLIVAAGRRKRTPNFWLWGPHGREVIVGIGFAEIFGSLRGR
jgi:hypothetical protein